MSVPLGVLIVGGDEREILALRDAAAPMISGQAAMSALQISTSAVDNDLVWDTRPLEVRQLSHDSVDQFGPVVEQFFSSEADIWKVISAAADRSGVSLVVIACHRRKRLGRVVTKSAATELLTHADIAVLAIPDLMLADHLPPCG